MPTSNLRPIPRILFMSRWLQLPLYLGLIVAQGVYVWYFLVELLHLVEAAFGNQDALAMILKNITPVGADTIKAAPETIVMLVVLGLIDLLFGSLFSTRTFYFPVGAFSVAALICRWLQLPLYLGLIVAQGVYVWYFWSSSSHLVEAAFGNQDALDA